MNTDRASRRLKFAVMVIGVALLYVAFDRWKFRQRTVRLSAPLGAIHDDIAAWNLALTAQQHAGINPNHYMILPFQASGTHSCVGRDGQSRDTAKLSFRSGLGSTIAEYTHIDDRLEQNGTTVSVSIKPSK